MPIKPIKVLCKRTEYNGKNHWWDNESSPPVRHERDNRMLVAGDWYDVVFNSNDVWDEEKRQFTFTIIDNQGNPHLFYMYDEQDKKDWPDICTKYGPRDYAKWFYTLEDFDLLNEGKFKLDEDIRIKPGQYHWVLTKDDNWVIAKCSSKHSVQGKFYWKMVGTDWDKSCFDFKEIGEQVVSRQQQLKDKKMAQATDELMDEVCVLIDAINKEDPDEEYPSVEYVMPFVNKAVKNYFDTSWDNLSDFFESQKRPHDKHL